MRSPCVILVIDDEEMVRDVMIAALETECQTILYAASGEEGLKVVAEHAGRIDLVLTDLRLPGMHGLEVRKRILQERADTKVVVLSGNTYGGAIPTGVVTIQKPFTIQQLRARVRELLTPPYAAT